MVYLCTSKEERALNKRVFSSFFGLKNGIFTSEIIFFTLLRKIFLGVCGFFLRNVDGFLGDLEGLKVKRYLFSRPHFLGGWERTREGIRGYERRGGGKRRREEGGEEEERGGAGRGNGERRTCAP